MIASFSHQCDQSLFLPCLIEQLLLLCRRSCTVAFIALHLPYNSISMKLDEMEPIFLALFRIRENAPINIDNQYFEQLNLNLQYTLTLCKVGMG